MLCRRRYCSTRAGDTNLVCDSFRSRNRGFGIQGFVKLDVSGMMRPGKERTACFQICSCSSRGSKGNLVNEVRVSGGVVWTSVVEGSRDFSVVLVIVVDVPLDSRWLIGLSRGKI